MPHKKDIPNENNYHIKQTSSTYINVQGIELEVYEGEDYVKMENEDEYIDTDQRQEQHSTNASHHTVASIICNNNRYGNDNVYVDFEQVPNQNRGRVQYSRNGIYDNENDNREISHNPILNTIVKKEEKSLRNRYCNKYSVVVLGIIGMAMVALISYAVIIPSIELSRGKSFLSLNLFQFLLIWHCHMSLLSDENLFIACNTINDTHTIAADGGNVSIPDQGKPCVFPFMYEGKEFFKCTTYSACSSCIWCGTQFNVTDDSGWGMCGERCAKEGEYE